MQFLFKPNLLILLFKNKYLIQKIKNIRSFFFIK